MAEVATALAPVITAEQFDLIRATIAKDATEAELQLFLFDCKRQGVHPLDRLIHFTKRGGKYTPITSIDFIRQRAAQTGECGGIDDALFNGTTKTADFTAKVTVYRIVQGQRCAFTATARWHEYKPEQHDFMWQRMPHTMLGKCAEALALRKAFPQQLAGLYAQEEITPEPQSPAGETETLIPPPPLPTSGFITEKQRKRLYAIARGSGWMDADIKTWFIAKGIGSTDKIRQDEYDAVVAMLEREAR